MTTPKALFLSASILLLAFARSHDGVGDIPAPLPDSLPKLPATPTNDGRYRDTLYVPLYERSDTTNAIILYLGPDGNVKHMNGKVISKGVKLQTGQWADPQRVTMILSDSKFNPVKQRVVDIIPVENTIDNKPKTK
jgi:hypothetical protein